jgi:uncharacterized protein with NRDE domain
MCTVTFIPQAGGNFILTSNRDENAARSPRHLTRIEQDGVTLIFPRDTAAGGTWIAAAEDGRVVCLLNGAFEKHKHQPPYKHSRGTMVLDFFSFPFATSFFEQYDFTGLEPFTFIIVDGEGALYELRWDEQQTHVKQLESKSYYIWSSSTLYPKDIRERREGWFREWLDGRRDFSLGAIQHFHRSGGEDDTWNGFVMNREGRVQTVSITNVVKNRNGVELFYNDLLRGMVKSERLTCKSNRVVENAQIL